MLKYKTINMERIETFIPVFRHGQFDGPGATRYNFVNFVSSLTDESKTYPLTTLGRSQILETVKEIPDYQRLGPILTSEFCRTQQSAQVVADLIKAETRRRVEIISTPLLNNVWMPPNSLSETEFIELEQSGRQNAVADEMFKRWADGRIGESPKMVVARINRFLYYLQETMASKKSQPIVITHASFASAILRSITGVPLTDPRDPEQILRVAGYYFLVANGDLKAEYLRISLMREKFLA